jgi:hypothetical protein
MSFMRFCSNFVVGYALRAGEALLTALRAYHLDDFATRVSVRLNRSLSTSVAVPCSPSSKLSFQVLQCADANT